MVVICNCLLIDITYTNDDDVNFTLHNFSDGTLPSLLTQQLGILSLGHHSTTSSTHLHVWVSSAASSHGRLGQSCMCSLLMLWYSDIYNFCCSSLPNSCSKIHITVPVCLHLISQQTHSSTKWISDHMVITDSHMRYQFVCWPFHLLWCHQYRHNCYLITICTRAIAMCL